MVKIFSQFVSRKTLLISVTETALITLAVIVGAKIRFWDSAPDFQHYFKFPDFFLQLLVLLVAMQASFYYSDLYNRQIFRRRHEEVLSIAQSLGGAAVCLGFVYLIWPSLLIGRGVLFLSLPLIALFVLVTRVGLDRAWRFAVPSENILILGSRQLGRTVAQELRERSDLNFNLRGFVNGADEGDWPGEVDGVQVLGKADRLEQIVETERISRIVVALEERRGGLPTRELVSLRVRGIRIEDAHTIMSSLTGRVWLETVRPSWFVFSEGFHRSRFNSILKWLMDMVLAVIMLILVAPIMIVVAILIRIDSKGPIIYRQSRVGLRGYVFEVLKFRSMRADAEAATGARWAQKHDTRITRVGKYLRKYRLDELPQLINVLKGQMSFVGPRPERPYFVEQLRKEISYYDERHSVRPGITGWAQVQYSYSDNVEGARRKLEYDLFYIKNLSIFFDCAILFKTVQVVFSGEGSR